MRRQRILRASSAQSLCIFCACRLGIENPAATAQLQRRHISTTRAPFQSATAATTAPENGVVEGNSSNRGLPAWYDPNSPLSMSEQQEKENRRQLRSEYQGQQNQAVQEVIWREEEQKNKKRAEAVEWKKLELEETDSGRRRDTSFRKLYLSKQEAGQSPETLPQQGQSLGEAMRPKPRSQQRQSRNDTRSNDQKGNVNNRQFTMRNKTYSFRKYDSSSPPEPENCPKTDASGRANNTPESGQQRQRQQPRQQQRLPPKVSNPFASGSQTNESGAGVAAGWGAAATETKPLEYSDAARPTRFGATEPTSVGPSPNPNIKEAPSSPRIVRSPIDPESRERYQKIIKPSELQQYEPSDEELRAQQNTYDRAAQFFDARINEQRSSQVQRGSLEDYQPRSPEASDVPSTLAITEHATERGLRDAHVSPSYTILEERTTESVGPQKSRDEIGPRTGFAEQPLSTSGRQSDSGPLADDSTSIANGDNHPRANEGSLGYFEEEDEPANPTRLQPSPNQTPYGSASDGAIQKRPRPAPEPASVMGSFGSYEADGTYQEEQYGRQAPPSQSQESARRSSADASHRHVSTPSVDNIEQQFGLGRCQAPSPHRSSSGSYESDSQLLDQQYDKEPTPNQTQPSQPERSSQGWGQTRPPQTRDEGGWVMQHGRAQQPNQPPPAAHSGWGVPQRAPKPNQPPAPAHSSPMTLGQQYGHLPECPCNLCNPEPAPAPQQNDPPTLQSRDRNFQQPRYNGRLANETQSALQTSGNEGSSNDQSFDPLASRYRYSNTGYMAMPFDPNEFRPTYTQSREDSANDWQHLRRRNSEPAPSTAVDPPPPTAPQPRQQYQPPRSDFLDDDWVDRTFQNHIRDRELRQQQASQQSTQQSKPGDDARYNRRLFDDGLTGDKKCGRCGEIGHVARQCKNPSRITYLTCGQIGHRARDCPQTRPAGRGLTRSVPSADRTGLEDSRDRQPFERRHSDGASDSRVRNPFDGPQSSSWGQRRGQRPSGQQAGSGRDEAREWQTGRAGSRADPFAERTLAAQGADRDSRGRYQPLRRAQWQEDEDTAAEDEQSRGKESRGKIARRSRWEDAEVEDVGRGADRGRKAQRGGRRAFDEDEDEEEGARDAFRARKAARQAEKEGKKQEERKMARQQRQAKKAENSTPITLPEFTSVQHLSQLLGVRYEQFVERLEELGYDDIFPGKTLNSETSSLIAMEYNFEPTFDAGVREEEERDLKAQPEAFDKELLPTRPPVVTIMGHVDHGKTTILDYLRKSCVAAGEAGGITQHIGAFSVPLASSGRTITFLDTPGHAAFLAMRQRGANVTDIVILVVAADDSVKPQTLEAIKHAKAAGVPMIVAINKVDKEEADAQRVKQDLARHGVEIEDFGGETQVVEVSGKTGRGMDELEETVVTLSEILDHRAETDGLVEGWILEATTKKAGRVATVLVRRGTLKTGKVIVAGKTWARVRTLKNEAGKTIHEVGPGMPVEVDGWKDQPTAGDEVLQAPTEQKANSVVEYRLEIDERQKTASDTEAINEARRIAQERQAKEKAAARAAKQAQRAANADRGAAASPEAEATLAEEEQSGQMVVPFIIKADVSGSAEAVSAYIMSVSNPLIAPSILHSGVGAVHESDIELADAAAGHIIAFNLLTDPEMNGAAEARGVKVLENNIIYRVLDDVKAVLEEKLPPIIRQRVLGEAEVGAAFEISVGGRKKMKIAGCKVRNGVVGIRSRVRVMRGSEKVYDGTITSLKNVKKDVQEMRKGSECGMGFEAWEGFEVGDQIQTYEEISEKRKLSA